MADIIQSLWIGPALGALQRLGIASFLRQGHEYHLYCYDEVANVPAGTVIRDAREVLPASSIFRYQEGFGAGSVAAFANLFRYKLLLDAGGWWVDTDVVCLRPFAFPDPVVLASDHTEEASGASVAVIRLPPGHDLARRCYEAAAGRGSEGLTWGETGPRLFQLAVQTGDLDPCVQGACVFSPIPCWGWRLALCPDRAAWLPFLRPQTRAVHLWHEMWRGEGLAGQTAFPPGCLLAHLLEEYQVDPTR